MIRIETFKEKEIYKKITFKGHANFDEYGKDIVCAAVSSTMLCTVNAILLINEKSIKVTKAKDLFIVELIDNADETTIKLLTNMMNCLKSLEREYPKNIKIK